MPEEPNSTDPTVTATNTDTTVAEKKDPPKEEKKSEPKVFDEAYVKELREESAKHRTERNAERESREKIQSQLDKLQEQLQEIEREKLSKEERQALEFDEAKSEVAKLKSEIQSTRLEAAVAKNVRKFELENADATVQLLDKSAVEYDERGNVSNIESVLEATLEKYPFLKSAGKKAPVDPGATNPGKHRQATLTREVIQNMTHTERAERMQEIQAWAARGYK